MRYQRCQYLDSGYCYNPGLRLGCVGYDRCEQYQIVRHIQGQSTVEGQQIQGQLKLSRIDFIGPNGNTGEHYEETNMSNNPMECEECGTTLKSNVAGDMYCPNEKDCLSVTGDKVEESFEDKVAKHTPGSWSEAVEDVPYRPTIGAEKLAEDHWEYIERVIAPYHTTEYDKKDLEIIKFHYKSAFIHGYKHAKEMD